MPTLRSFARPSRLAVFAVPIAALGFASVAHAQGDPAGAPPVASSAAPPPAPPPDPKAVPAASNDAGKPSLLPPDAADPGKDKSSLEKEGEVRPDTGEAKGSSGAVFSDDWWTHTRPIVELHGFFRTRAELFHNFSLGRIDDSSKSVQNLFPRPLDDSYTDYSGVVHHTPGCGPASDPQSVDCTNKTNASANLRFRVDPEIHISDNLRIMSQIDFLDNLVLGSTPEGYANYPGGSAPGAGGYSYVGGGGYVPLRSFSTSQVPPTAGVNSYQNSVVVKRVWGEYVTPIGQVRFGRMGSNWGLGILSNSGDRIDSDYQTTVDRILFVTGSRALDLYVAGMWDFPNSGRTNASIYDLQGQPYNVSQLENTSEWVLAIFRKVRPEILAQKLAHGDTVFNGGTYTVYRQQILANESQQGASLGSNADQYHNSLIREGAKSIIPDLWFQVLTKRIRWETEAVYIYGSIENPVGVLGNKNYTADNYKIRQFGIASEFEYHALNDDLKLRFWTGFATGDQGVNTLSPGTGGLQARQTSDKTVSTFRFHPDYRVDLILWRNILTRVEGAYYFRPGVEYDFTKSLDGEKLGGRAEIIWSRASKFVQTPGHKEDLGVELDLSLYYQSKDGSLNDDPSKIGGFFSMLQYGVLFPLGGLGYMSQQKDTNGKVYDVSTAQVVRLFMGIQY